MLIPSVVNTAQLCAQLGVRHVIVSPGSRNAPLTLAFVRHPEITTKVISDERSAAFVGLGMAQRLRQPVGLVCTSGSAAYNYAPAVAEAFFQQVPLLVFTADRPPEWIDQLDGQTIRQRNLYGPHVKASYELPVGQTDADQAYAARIVAEAIDRSREFPAGPVHVNVPIREPFYPEGGEVMRFDENEKVIRSVPGQPSLPEETRQALSADWTRYERKLIVGGQSERDEELIEALEQFSTAQQLPVVAEVISNLHPLSLAVAHADELLANSPSDLSPDLLITFGRSVLSKHLKRFLRQHRPAAHWHIQVAGPAADTFQSLTHVLRTTPTNFFRRFRPPQPPPAQASYAVQWAERERAVRQRLADLFVPKQPEGEFQAMQTVLQQLPDAVDLHLANSMTVRYVNLVGLPERRAEVEVFANRGTCGIDGSSSTAVGSALASGRPTVLLTGDLAFFYDRNAFWHNYLLPNLRMVLFNNHGGGIFRLIDGPGRQPELEEYFETRQTLTAERTARDFGMEYNQIDLTEPGTLPLLSAYLTDFYGREGEHAKLLEIVTDSRTNQAVYDHYRRGVVSP